MIMNEKKIAIIGSGALGTSLGRVLYNKGYKNIVIFGVDEEELKDLSQGKNTKYFPPTINIPNFKTTNILKEALTKAVYVILAVPSVVMDKVYLQVLESLDSEVLVINGSKGFYPKTQNSLQEGLTNASKGNKKVRGVVSLIGPSHAEEIVTDTPTAVAAVSNEKKLNEEVQKLFLSDNFKVYSQTDVRGAEVGAAYKNILAISSGIVTGLGYGINTVAALLTRGLSEMRQFNKAMKGKNETLMGLTGIGDMIVTCLSPLSRNWTFGKSIVDLGIEKALQTQKTVEGIAALKSVWEIAQEKKLNLPIIEFLYSIVFLKHDPKEFRGTLWSKTIKAE